MIEVSSLVALIVAEVIVGLLVLSGLLLLLTLLRKGRIRKAAAHLAERVKTDSVKREERLRALLEDRYQYQGTELEQSLHNLMQTEMLLYQNVINGFLKDDQLYLQQIDVDVENLVLGYQGLDIEIPESTPTQDSDSADEIAKLQEENTRLSEELRVTMDTMGRMLNEYSTMFEGNTDADQTAASPAAEEPLDSEQVEIATAEIDQQETPREPMEQTASADSTVEVEPSDEMDSDLISETESPDVSADELGGSSYLEPGIDSESEVSEIIDEVLEMADEMIEETSQTDAASETGESMVDDLEKIDIEIPDADAAMTREDEAQAGSSEEDDIEAEAGSLEEEWAKLLEEDAANKQQD